jgi:hypothetical protein
MMATQKIIYRATHIETGEVHEGTAEELAPILQINNYANIHSSYTRGFNIHNWHLDRIFAPDYIVRPESNISIKFIKEWNEVTAPFRKLSEQKRRKAEKLC